MRVANAHALVDFSHSNLSLPRLHGPLVQAVEKLNNTKLKGRSVVVDWAVSKDRFLEQRSAYPC